VKPVLLLLVSFMGIACAPRDRAIRLERLAAETRNLEATFDHLEDRLVVNQARVRFWQEMRSRHESVSAIACASLEEHAVEMAERVSPSHRSLHASRVASATGAAAIERVPAAASGGSR
jgi:hypothetical protein